ncbi:flagellar biosynthetic protein FliR [Nitratidesulfovibrio vulgaris]|jgi:flagellar biosynthetic protein FliR|uniref:Flagellar biosynthetic protein FliR n=2 Tax=Nitratidesulfovibrio vulgaris TaxID=881 RepID=Q3V886_NITV2|nr:flagellar biosynthetic protein FliR [Nitratidesulfovibrio vulgaris]GEB78708.1 flagellar biosynthetic protein FliR [Desulfovibrio desulfuricans]HBW15071.1 flagellar biosynthetic protein FliR [Desulfovibrio sp.]AAS97704.1 flagellar biosynthetic protein FliR [Nitratidesulfovibrio vulgaris str. Hildenborough]ABM27178.1 flagellar biosynthetic protein FliR [Nitratidesulfovibrio vulgaris DP4]ADP88132.1 flagellar biosynthetic protein FliR [Nitratidesulfovibrio vulgaris RCH1]
MDLFAFDPATTLGFLLTFMRVSLVMFLLPFFGGDAVPMQVKVALCLVMAMALWPRLSLAGAVMPSHPFELVVMLASELVLGLVLGMAVHFLFAGIQTGGQLLGFQMGFTMISIADPLSGAQISITSHFLYMVSLLTFLALDGHLFLLRAFAESFALVPAGGLVANPAVANELVRLAGGMFVIAVKIAAPVLVTLFLVELALALMARAAPQMNLLMIGFPLKIAVGFFFMGLLFTILAQYIEEFIIGMPPMMLHLLHGVSPKGV